MSLVMKCIKKHFKAYCDQIYKRTGVSVYWSIDNSLQCLQKLEKATANSIQTYDFSTLYTNLPLQKIYDSLEQLVIKMFKNSRHNYILVSIYNKKAFWSNVPKNGYKTYSLDKVLTALNWILFNTYVSFAGNIFKQIKGIPMGGNCSPLIADLYLSWIEYCYLSKLLKSDLSLAKKLSLNCRYIDDIVTPNITNFLDIASKIYPKELPLEESSSGHTQDQFLDLNILVGNKCFITSIYHKVDLFNFEVISFPFPESNILTRTGYSTFLSQLIRYSRVCTFVDDFAMRAQGIHEKLLKRGYNLKLLKKYFIRFCCYMSDIVHKYGFYNFTNFYEFCKHFKPNKLNETKKIYRPSQAFDSTKNGNFANFKILLPKNNDVPRPIFNIGNTCYLNAILQILFGLNKICHFEQWALQRKKFDGFSCVNIRNLLAYWKFLYLASLKDISKANIHDFVCILGNADSFFSQRIQQDAHEALLKLFNVFDNGITAVYPGFKGINENIFRGTVQIVNTCAGCGTNFVSFEPFYDINIQPVANIKSAIENALHNKNGEFNCTYCESLQKCDSLSKIYEHPKVLLVLVNRYTISPYSNTIRKNNTKICLEQEMSLYGRKYELNGVVLHIGTSTTSGHYIANVKMDKFWYSCNDSSVEKVKSLSNPCSNAYLLFYT